MMRWLLLLAVAASGCTTTPEFDLVISGGTVYEGLDTTPRRVDLGIKGDRIVAIGNLQGRRSGVVIDAAGKVVTPGFIDASSRSTVTLLADGAGESHLRQGITTHILTEPVPLASDADSVDLLRRFGITIDWQDRAGYLARLQQRGTASNVALMTAQPDASTFAADLTAGSAGAWIALAGNGDPTGDVSGGNAVARQTAIAVADEARNVSATVVLDSPSGMPAADAVRAAIETARAAQLGLIGVRVDIGPTPPPEGPGSLGDLFNLVRPEIDRGLYTGLIIDPMQLPAAAEQDDSLRQLLAWAELMIGTNAPAVGASGALSAMATPAAFGAFPRLFGEHVRTRKHVSFGEALRRATSVPATRLRIPNRGLLREGYFADVVVFDEAAIGARATAESPAQFPTGIDYVVVNGVVVVTAKGYTGARPGRVLMGPGFPRPTQ